MEEKGCRDNGKVNGGDLKSHRGVWSRVIRGSGIFQIFGEDTALSGRGLAGGSPERLEGETSLGAVRESTKA